MIHSTLKHMTERLSPASKQDVLIWMFGDTELRWKKILKRNVFSVHISYLESMPTWLEESVLITDMCCQFFFFLKVCVLAKKMYAAVMYHLFIMSLTKCFCLRFPD